MRFVVTPESLAALNAFEQLQKEPELYSILHRSEFSVAAVTEWLVGTVLATAEVHGLRLRGCKLHGSEISALVAAVTEWLCGTSSARTPVVNLRSFHFDWIRALLRNYRF